MFVAIDDRDPRPAYQQIAAAIKQQVSVGALAPGAELPAVRELARELGINLHTARHAYQVLSQQGIIHLRLGRRARVAPLRETPAEDGEIETHLVRRIEELLTEAYHLGVPPQQLRALLEQAIDRQQSQRKSP
jgi:GntR family transcriptional regulator